MEIKINDLTGKTIQIESKRYSVTDVRLVAGNTVVKTNVRSFNLLPSEIDAWMDKIMIVEEKAQWIPDSSQIEIVHELVPVEVKHVHHVEIMAQNEVSGKITDKLLKMFDEIDENPSEKAIKKAQTMVNVSNAIVAVQMANFKFLNLKSK